MTVVEYCGGQFTMSTEKNFYLRYILFVLQFVIILLFEIQIMSSLRQHQNYTLKLIDFKHINVTLKLYI